MSNDKTKITTTETHGADESVAELCDDLELSWVKAVRKGVPEDEIADIMLKFAIYALAIPGKPLSKEAEKHLHRQLSSFIRERQETCALLDTIR